MKLHVADTRPAAGSTIVFAGLMFACATGMWMMRYWAVLGFMALMALLLLFFSFALIKASSLLGFAIAIARRVHHGLLVLQARPGPQPPAVAAVPRPLTSRRKR